jgi:hypothetical protein
MPSPFLAFSYWRSVHHVPERVSTMCPVQNTNKGRGYPEINLKM